MPQVPLNLTPKLQLLNSGVVRVLTGPKSKVDATKILPMYSKGVLASENLLSDAVLVGFSQQVNSHLNKAKTLMNQLGVKDITKAPAIRVNQPSLRVVPGCLHVSASVAQPVSVGASSLAARAVASAVTQPVETSVPVAGRVTEAASMAASPANFILDVSAPLAYVSVCK